MVSIPRFQQRQRFLLGFFRKRRAAEEIGDGRVGGAKQRALVFGWQKSLTPIERPAAGETSVVGQDDKGRKGIVF